MTHAGVKMFKEGENRKVIEQMPRNTTGCAPICVCAPEANSASDRRQHWQQTRAGYVVPVADSTIPLLRKRHLNWTDWILFSVSSGFRLTRWMPNQH
jgi:hypothetical protein